MRALRIVSERTRMCLCDWLRDSCTSMFERELINILTVGGAD